MIRTHITNNILIDRRIRYDNSALAMKPSGLWYAEGMSWVEWCEDNMPDFLKSKMFSLEIDLSYVAVLDTKDKVLEFTDKYKMSNFGILSGIDWQAVKQDFKGIEAIPYFYSLRFASPSLLWYYGLDVPSGCLWDLSALIKTKVVSEQKQFALRSVV